MYICNVFNNVFVNLIIHFKNHIIMKALVSHPVIKTATLLVSSYLVVALLLLLILCWK